MAKTGRNPYHYAVILPKPVTEDVASTFNELFRERSELNPQTFGTIGRLLDTDLETDKRIAAAKALVSTNEPEALDALTKMATLDSLPDLLARSVGASLGIIVCRNGLLYQTPLEDFSEQAYLGFDEVVAAIRRGSGGQSNVG